MKKRRDYVNTQKKTFSGVFLTLAVPNVSFSISSRLISENFAKEKERSQLIRTETILNDNKKDGQIKFLSLISRDTLLMSVL